MVTITTNVIEFLKRSGMTVNDYVYLYSKYLNNEWDTNVFPFSDSRLLLLEYINEEGEITQKCRDLIEKSLSENKINSISSKEFDSWWDAFPISDEHGFFPMTRPLRVKKEECRILFNQVLKNGITLDNLLSALDREVTTKRVRSIDQNEMKFMPNSLNYLQGQYYLPWIETEQDSAKKLSSQNDRFKLL